MKELIYPRLFFPAVADYPDRIGLICGANQSTNKQHASRVMRLGSSLARELGVKKGDRFAVLALNSREYVELYHAAYLGAGIINPLNLRLAGKELDYIIRDSGTQVIFVDKTFAQPMREALDRAGEKTSVRAVVLIGDGPDSLPFDLHYEDLIESGRELAPAEPEEDDPVVLMYTGGTTGQPKGVLLSQRAEILNVYHVAMRFDRLKPDEVALLQTPIFHAASMVAVLGTQAWGGTLVVQPTFDPGETLRLIERHHVTQTVMVPTMIHMMLSHPEFKPERLASLESLTYGASPMPSVLLDRLQSLFPKLELAQGYGMTESSSVLTFLNPEDHAQRGPQLRSVGKPLKGIELSIQDEQGDLLPRGVPGEVCAKGGNYMIEYWNKPEATREAFRGGWYHTGDAGYIDEQGYLFLVDRLKDMIVSGGENVYSTEVENAIADHPAVAQVAVIGIPDDTWGEAVHAIVVLKPGAEVSAEHIIEHARGNIAGYKVPKSVEFRSTALPLSGALKVLKRELREPYWKGHERRIN